jgi:glyceraldehyde 3-phosphate dehydrogenase
MTREISQQYLSNWNNRQALAEKMIPLLGNLYRGPSVVVRVFGQKIMNASTIEIIKSHLHGRLIVGEALDMNQSYAMLQLIEQMNLRPCRLDLGKLCHEYLSQDSDENMQVFLLRRLSKLLGDKQPKDDESHDVVLYGFGRIGRLLARLLIDRTGTGA